MNKNDIPILLVEDDDDDIRLTQRAFTKGRITNKMYIVRDGEEAMDFLEHKGKYSNSAEAPRPGIILLDLNMPKMSGREVLERIKNDEHLCTIPVIILTTSESEEDILESYQNGANTFITKPVEFGKFVDAVVTLGKYWLSIAELPQEEMGYMENRYQQQN